MFGRSWRKNENGIYLGICVIVPGNSSKHEGTESITFSVFVPRSQMETFDLFEQGTRRKEKKLNTVDMFIVYTLVLRILSNILYDFTP